MRPTQPPFQWVTGFFPGVEAAGTEVPTHLHLLSSLRMSGAVPRLPHMSSCRDLGKLCFLFNPKRLSSYYPCEIWGSGGSDKIAVLRYKTPCSLVEVTDVLEPPVNKSLFSVSVFASVLYGCFPLAHVWTDWNFCKSKFSPFHDTNEGIQLFCSVNRVVALSNIGSFRVGGRKG